MNYYIVNLNFIGDLALFYGQYFCDNVPGIATWLFSKTWQGYHLNTTKDESDEMFVYFYLTSWIHEYKRYLYPHL